MEKKKFDREEAMSLIARGEIDKLLDFDLRGADLRDANLCDADIDYACWPLWCGGLHVKIDKYIACQLAYHFCNQDCDDSEYIAARNAILNFANQFRRAEECGLLEPRNTR